MPMLGGLFWERALLPDTARTANTSQNLGEQHSARGFIFNSSTPWKHKDRVVKSTPTLHDLSLKRLVLPSQGPYLLFLIIKPNFHLLAYSHISHVGSAEWDKKKLSKASEILEQDNKRCYWYSHQQQTDRDKWGKADASGPGSHAKGINAEVSKKGSYCCCVIPGTPVTTHPSLLFGQWNGSGQAKWAAKWAQERLATKHGLDKLDRGSCRYISPTFLLPLLHVHPKEDKSLKILQQPF